MNEQITGESLKEIGIKRVTRGYPEWHAGATAEIVKLASQQSQITADDIRHLQAPHPNCVGAAFNAVAKRGLIRCVGWQKATTASAHARKVSVWERVENQG